MSGTYVSITRKWHHPTIVTTVSDEKINLHIDMADFEKALAAELGATLGAVTTRAAVLSKLGPAVKAVLEGVKEESAKVPDLP